MTSAASPGTDPNFDAGGLLDPDSTPKTPSAARSAVAVTHGRGASRFSVEEGRIRSIAVDAVGLGHGRNVLHDQTLARNAGIGRLYNQTLFRTSHAAIARRTRPYWRFASDSNRSPQPA